MSISNAPINTAQSDASGLAALSWTGWYTQVAGALTAFDQTGNMRNGTALYALAPGNQWKGARLYQDASNNFTLDTNTRASVSGSDGWVNALKVNSGGGATLAANAQIAHAGQASLDLWNTTSGTPAGGSRWRIFSDNVGGGGGNLTFGIYDLANARLPLGIDNNGVVTIGGNLSSPRFNNQYVFNTTGPISNAHGGFTSHGGLMVCFFFATGYVTTAGAAAVTIFMDGGNIGTIPFYFNQTNTHTTLVPLIMSRYIPAGSHTFSFGASANLQTDGGDTFQAYVMEFPF